MKTRVSIAMATYNGARYVREQLDSFARQRRLPDELVVCDDGSCDSTLEIVNDFARRAAFPVRIAVNDANVGYTRNFEKALSLCDGELIFLSDQDDVWFDTKIEEILAYIESHPKCLMVTHDLLITDKDLNPSTTFNTTARQAGRSVHTNFHMKLPALYCMPGCSMTIKKSWRDICLPFPRDISVAHDNWLDGLALLVGVRDLYDSPLQYYRRHGCNSANSITFEDKMTPAKFLVLDFMRFGLKDARPGWRRTYDTVLQFRERLNERAAALDALGLRGARLAAIEKIAVKQAALEGRIALASKPRYRRALSVASLWQAGGYRQFEGWRSALKDLVR